MSTSNAVRLGRAADNDLVIAHPSISAHHAELHFDGEQFLLRDLSSSNGTFVNGGRVDARARVEVGDLVHFATFDYEIVQALQPTTGEDAPAIPTHVLTSSVDIKGIADLFNIVRDQRVLLR